jgi:hypothetical protein
MPRRQSLSEIVCFVRRGPFPDLQTLSALRTLRSLDRARARMDACVFQCRRVGVSHVWDVLVAPAR